MNTSFFAQLLAVILVWTSFSAPSQAFWPFSSNNEDAPRASYSDPVAPDPEWKDEHCEPLRQEAIELNQTHSKYNPLREIRVSRLKQRHRKCIKEFEAREYQYLKQVSIQNKPSNTGPSEALNQN